VTLVVDASVVIAALVDSERQGDWARDRMRSDNLAAPHLMPVEAAYALRKAELTGEFSSDFVALSYRDVVELSVELHSFEPLADRVWQLRANVTPYDAWYVALAEQLDSSLVTLDRRLAAAAGPTCEFETPPL
jgi:predicted nucleic acid-binding protein